jgi:hypothetical protein
VLTWLLRPSQYESQFKKWGWKKYHSGTDWKVVCRHLRKHVENNEDVSLSFQGAEVSEKTWRERLQSEDVEDAEEATGEHRSPHFRPVLAGQSR